MITFAQSIQGYNLAAQARRLSPHTLADYNNTFRKLLKFTGDLPIISLDSNLIREFLTAQPVAPKTLLNYHVGLSALFTWLQAEGLVDDNPMRLVQRPRRLTRAVVPFTETDLHALLSIASRTHNADRDRAVILMLLDTGLRASELCSLAIQDVDLKNRLLRVIGKGAKERQLPFSPRTAQSIWKYLTGRPGAPVDQSLFVTQIDSPFTRDRLLKHLVAMGIRAGVPNCHPHRFRHTFAIQYLRNGGDPFTLQLLLGHSDMATVRIYLNLAQCDLQAAHQRSSPVDRWRL